MEKESEEGCEKKKRQRNLGDKKKMKKKRKMKTYKSRKRETNKQTNKQNIGNMKQQH